jgi:hypothetical protein
MCNNDVVVGWSHGGPAYLNRAGNPRDIVLFRPFDGAPFSPWHNPEAIFLSPGDETFSYLSQHATYQFPQRDNPYDMHRSDGVQLFRAHFSFLTQLNDYHIKDLPYVPRIHPTDVDTCKWIVEQVGLPWNDANTQFANSSATQMINPGDARK